MSDKVLASYINGHPSIRRTVVAELEKCGFKFTGEMPQNVKAIIISLKNKTFSFGPSVLQHNMPVSILLARAVAASEVIIPGMKLYAAERRVTFNNQRIQLSTLWRAYYLTQGLNIPVNSFVRCDNWGAANKLLHKMNHAVESRVFVDDMAIGKLHTKLENINTHFFVGFTAGSRVAITAQRQGGPHVMLAGDMLGQLGQKCPRFTVLGTREYYVEAGFLRDTQTAAVISSNQLLMVIEKLTGESLR